MLIHLKVIIRLNSEEIMMIKMQLITGLDGIPLYRRYTADIFHNLTDFSHQISGKYIVPHFLLV